MTIFELNRLISYDDDALLAELRRVAALIDSPYITQNAFNKLSKASASVIRRRFGGWQQALARAGLADRYSGAVVSKKMITRAGQTFSDEELLLELHQVSEKVAGKPITTELFNQHATIHAETVRRRFGSWSAALKKAGLTVAKRSKRYSEDDYFENLLTVWTHHGRQPKYREMDEAPSSISSGAYEAKWGNWTKALLAFLERVNSDSRPENSRTAAANGVQGINKRETPQRMSKPAPVRKENQRQIKLGLRYEVLKRDRFRCLLCGASPATHVGCILHVDHVIPYSRDGKTVADNLRTLCDQCNLGKSARLE